MSQYVYCVVYIVNWIKSFCFVATFNFLNYTFIYIAAPEGKTRDMFKRKLTALDYHNPTEEFVEVEAFRQMIVWLEDQKIRHYKIEDRAALHDTKSADWDTALQKYEVLYWFELFVK